MFKDREYLQGLLKIGVPIALQQLLFACFNVLDTLMMGQLGEQSIAAVGLANQIGFLFNMILFGMVNAASIFSAQYWGIKDTDGIHKVTRLTLTLALGIGSLFFLVTAFLPEVALGFYTEDQLVIELGAQYLRLISFTYLTSAIYITYTTIMRTTRQVKLPTIIAVVGLAFNMLLNYLLIFGHLGFTPMGVRGAGLGSLIVRILQLIVLLVIIYKHKYPAAAPLRNFDALSKEFILRYFKTAAPVLINETMWGFAITTIYSIYGHISTEAIASINISASIEQIIFVAAIGIANASATLVGNEIGAGNNHKATLYAGRSVLLSLSITFVLGIGMFLLAPWLVTFYQVSEATRYAAQRVMQSISMVIWIRATLVTTMIGILRPGGDTRFTLMVDGVIVWVVGVSMAHLGANVLGLPVYWVYLMVASEEAIKAVICLLRFRSGKWINNLVRTEAEAPLVVV